MPPRITITQSQKAAYQTAATLLCGASLTAAYLLCALGTAGLAQQITGTPGSPERHDDDRRASSSRRRRRRSAA